MNEETDVKQRPLDSRTNIRVSLGAIVGLVLSGAAILYGQIQYLHNDYETKFALLSEKIDGKADKGATKDRFTGKDGAALAEASKAAHTALQRELVMSMEAMRRELDHVHFDLDQHKEECRRNHDHK